MASRYAHEPDRFDDDALSTNSRDEVDERERSESETLAVLAEARFWQDVNNLSLEYPDFTVEVITHD